MASRQLTNLLTFLQNGNVVRIQGKSDYERFESIMLLHHLSGLTPDQGYGSYTKTVALLRKDPKNEMMIRNREWDGKTLYAECQIGKESIGIYPYTVRATVEWYGTEPFSVSDIDDGSGE